VSTIIDKVDVNGDGVMQYKELVQACRKYGTGTGPAAAPPRHRSRSPFNNNRDHSSSQNQEGSSTTPKRGRPGGRAVTPAGRAVAPGRAASRGRSRTPGREREQNNNQNSRASSRSRGGSRASPRRASSPGGGLTESRAERGEGIARGSIYYNRFRKGYTKLTEAANKSLAEVTPTILKTMRQVIQAYRPPIALVCLEALCLIIYEKPPADHGEAMALLKQPDLRECLLRATPESLSQTGVCRLRQLLLKMTNMEYNQVRAVHVLTTWMQNFEKAVSRSLGD